MSLDIRQRGLPYEPPKNVRYLKQRHFRPGEKKRYDLLPIIDSQDANATPRQRRLN